MDKESEGALLAFSGGVYTWAAVGECFGPAAERTKTMKAIVYKSAAFCLGCLCIGDYLQVKVVVLSHKPRIFFAYRQYVLLRDRNLIGTALCD